MGGGGGNNEPPGSKLFVRGISFEVHSLYRTLSIR
jgi:hypothetical protein